MKILLISNDISFTNVMDSYFAKKGYSTINYKWLIKAMDNLEEIKPEVIIISADEYPRHWKTLVQFMQSGLAGNNYKIYLYTKNKNQQELQKIRELNITKIFDNLDSVTINVTFNNLFKSNEIVKKDDKKSVQQNQNIQNNVNPLIITNPGTHNYVDGEYTFVTPKIIKFVTKDKSYLPAKDDYIKKLSYKYQNKYFSTNGKIIDVNEQDNNRVLTIHL
jgi:anthranilate/para-aminobenzoate synthase component II